MDDVKISVRAAYDAQRLRVQTGLRIVILHKKRLGMEVPGAKSSLDNEDYTLLDTLSNDLADTYGVNGNLPPINRFSGRGLLLSYSEALAMHNYVTLLEYERKAMSSLQSVIAGIPIYERFFSKVVGCDAAMAGALITEIDITKAEYPSSIHRYCGLDVVHTKAQGGKIVQLETGEGRCTRKDHLVRREYVDGNGITRTRYCLAFKPWLKARLLTNLAPAMIEQGSQYASVYFGYKSRLANNEKYKNTTKAHRHYMAVRYMIKRFLTDMHIAWRTVEGLPVKEDYAATKLGVKSTEGRMVVSIS